jgi:5'-3' exonuclease
LKSPLYLVDASLYVFRAWHSMPDQFHDADGWPTNAVHGFARFVLELLEQERPQHIAIAFDEALDSCFRNKLYPAYKANRDPAPEELKRQFTHCKALCAALGLNVLAHSEYEADDLIGSALHAVRGDGFRGVIVSADKDLSQLLGEFDEQCDPGRGLRWGRDGVKARHGVHAAQIADYLALCGDAVDNIPGIPGVGMKTAANLLAKFETLENLLANIEQIGQMKFRGAKRVEVLVREHQGMARLSKQLTLIVHDESLPTEHHALTRQPYKRGELDDLFEQINFGKFRRQALRHGKALSEPAEAALVAQIEIAKSSHCLPALRLRDLAP